MASYSNVFSLTPYKENDGACKYLRDSYSPLCVEIEVWIYLNNQIKWAKDENNMLVETLTVGNSKCKNKLYLLADGIL